MRIARVIQCVDAHAEGEPSRIVVGGVLDVPGTTMLEKMQALEADDRLRRVLLFEPRGSAPLSGDIVFESAHPEADAGFVIMESSSYEGMSGTNTINTAAVLLETGVIEKVEPVTELVLEAPAGLVRVRAWVSGGVVERIEFENVPSFATALWTPRSRSPTSAPSAVDVAYGGAFCAFVDAAALGFAIVPDEARDLADLGERIRPQLNEQVTVAASADPGALAPVLRRLRRAAAGRRRRAPRDDRLPRAAGPLPDGDGDLGADRGAVSARVEMGETYIAESVIDTRFVGRVAGATRVGDLDAVVPGDHGPRLDHGVPPARRRPGRPARRGLQARRHVGRRRRRRRAQRLT